MGGTRFDHRAVLLCGDGRRDRAREVVRQGGGGGGGGGDDGREVKPADQST